MAPSFIAVGAEGQSMSPYTLLFEEEEARPFSAGFSGACSGTVRTTVSLPGEIVWPLVHSSTAGNFAAIEKPEHTMAPGAFGGSQRGTGYSTKTFLVLFLTLSIFPYKPSVLGRTLSEIPPVTVDQKQFSELRLESHNCSETIEDARL